MQILHGKCFKEYLSTYHTQKAIVNRLNIENELKTIILNDKNESIEKNIDNIKSFKNYFFDNMEKAEPLFTSDTGKKYFKDAKISADKYFKIILFSNSFKKICFKITQGIKKYRT